MCGIAGIVNTTERSVSQGILKAMGKSLAHRGPDDSGFWSEDNIGLVHQRLSIIDLSAAGHQPMETPDGQAVFVYSGTVYNFPDLRLELESQGQIFKSNSDTEVVLRMLRIHGIDAIHQFNGMFAFGCIDKDRRKFYLARDRYGIIPVYYSWIGGSFVFASEIKALLKHPALSANVSLPALNEYFTFQNTFTSRTLFDGIQILMPGHYLEIDLETYTTKTVQYWDFDFNDGLENSSEEEITENLMTIFERAVNRHLVSDVEIGSYLSGGIDSGAVTSVAADNFRNLKTFTAGFDLSSATGLELTFDEREKAEYLSNLYKTEHYEIVLKAGDMERVMQDLIWNMEELRLGQSYPNFYVARLASKFVKVVLSGSGGDEIFGGYPWRYYRASDCVSVEDYAHKYYGYWQRLVPDRLKHNFFQPDAYKAACENPTEEIFRSFIRFDKEAISSPAEYVNRSFYLEAKTFLHGLLVLENKLSMAYGLETRTPFLDNELVDYATKIPVRYKLKNLREPVTLNENEVGSKNVQYFQKTGDGKLILRKALTKFVPEEYTMGRKQGFSAPDASWFKGESIDYIKRLLLNRNAMIYEFIQPDMTRTLLNEHFTGKRNRRLLIWSLLSFEWWLRVFMR